MDWADLTQRAQALQRKLLSRVRILLVDDEPIILELLGEILKGEGFSVDTALSATEAWSLINESEYDLLVTDKNLPQMSGVDLIRKVKEHGIDLPSVIITGYASVETVSDALENGAEDYITKPFDDIFLVIQRLRRVIDRRVSGLVFALVVNKLKAVVADGGLAPGMREKLKRELSSFRINLDQRLDALVVDQASPLVTAICEQLHSSGVLTEQTERLRDLLARLEEPNPPLVVLVRLDFPELVPLIQELQRSDPQLEILAFARGEAPLDRALTAVRGGATDFVLFSAEGFAVLESRVKRAMHRAHRRLLNLHLVATLYALAQSGNEDNWAPLLALLPEADRDYIEASAVQITERMNRRPTIAHLMDTANTERRAHPRYLCTDPVRVTFHENDSPHSIVGTGRDLSCGGIHLVGAKPPVGTSVMLHVGHEQIPLLGRVVRHHEDGCAIEFIEQEERVRALVEALKEVKAEHG